MGYNHILIGYMYIGKYRCFAVFRLNREVKAYEKNISAQENSSQKRTWVYEENVNFKRQKGSCSQKSKRQKAVDLLSH